MTHCRLPSDIPRSCWAEGSAMFTMVASRTTISWASAMKLSAFQRLECAELTSDIAVELPVSDMGVPTPGLRSEKDDETRTEGSDKRRGRLVDGDGRKGLCEFWVALYEFWLAFVVRAGHGRGPT